MTTLTIELPEPLTQQARGYGISQQQLQELMVGFIQNFLGIYQQHSNSSPSITTDTAISVDIATDLTQLEFLDDLDLWQAAQTQLTSAETAQMQTLLDKQQLEGLTHHEQTLAQTLSQRYQRTMLIRAKAAGLLHQRGLDISKLRQRKTKP